MPASGVPAWDFDMAPFGGAPPDSSAAAIASAGLLDLARLEPRDRRADEWLEPALHTLRALSAKPWRANPDRADSILVHGTYDFPRGRTDQGLVWGDYYYLQALQRAATEGGQPAA